MRLVRSPLPEAAGRRKQPPHWLSTAHDRGQTDGRGWRRSCHVLRSLCCVQLGKNSYLRNYIGSRIGVWMNQKFKQKGQGNKGSKDGWEGIPGLSLTLLFEFLIHPYTQLICALVLLCHKIFQ